MIQIVQDSSHDKEEMILARLVADNKERCAWMRGHGNPDWSHCNFLLMDGGELAGGAVGYIAFDWYFLDLLHVKKEYRGGQWGSRLLREIEDFARRQGLTGVRLETWDFQARGFYEKNGFSVFGELADCPPGTRQFFMQKRLNAPV